MASQVNYIILPFCFGQYLKVTIPKCIIIISVKRKHRQKCRLPFIEYMCNTFHSFANGKTTGIIC